MNLNKVIIRYGMSDTNVYQNKWTRPTGTADTRGLVTNLAGATRERFRADYSYLIGVKRIKRMVSYNHWICHLEGKG